MFSFLLHKITMIYYCWVMHVLKRVCLGLATVLFISAPVYSSPTPAVANNTITSLEVAGFTVSWPKVMYLPTGCSRFEFKYVNNSPYALLQVGFNLTDPYGDSIENDSLIGAPPGKSGIWDKQICSFDLKSGLGPYKIKVFIEDYDARGGGTLEKYTDIFFTARPGSASKIVVCTKNSSIKTYTGKNPKCPKGWKKL